MIPPAHMARKSAASTRISSCRPATSIVHAVLHRHGLVNVYRWPQPSHKAQGTRLSRPVHPNELRCADYKGEFLLAGRRYCYPRAGSPPPKTPSAQKCCRCARNSSFTYVIGTNP